MVTNTSGLQTVDWRPGSGKQFLSQENVSPIPSACVTSVGGPTRRRDPFRGHVTLGQAAVVDGADQVEHSRTADRAETPEGDVRRVLLHDRLMDLGLLVVAGVGLLGEQERPVDPGLSDGVEHRLRDARRVDDLRLGTPTVAAADSTAWHTVASARTEMASGSPWSAAVTWDVASAVPCGTVTRSAVTPRPPNSTGPSASNVATSCGSRPRRW